MRVVVVGAGVVALLTTVECVLAGHEVTVVDQGSIPFPGATSFDRHRVIRMLHQGDVAATAAAVRVHRRWIELERLLLARFYCRVGTLTVLPRDQVGAALSVLSESATPARALDAGQLATAYPHLSLGADVAAVLEPAGGVLLADRVLAACVGWLRWQSSVRLCPRRAAAAVDGRTAQVRLADGEVLRPDATVVAIGPWSRRLLPPDAAGRLTLYRQSMVYCRVPGERAAAWSATPAIPSLGTVSGAWLVPPVAGTPLKLSAASACRAVDSLTGNHTPDRWREHLLRVFAGLIPGLHDEWVSDTRDCYYLARADTGGPQLVALGDAVLSYAACGGSSFKFAPLVARSIAQRITGSDPEPTGLQALDQRPPPCAALAEPVPWHSSRERTRQ